MQNNERVPGRAKKGPNLGFKALILGLFEGTSFMPLDFSIHTEKPISARHRKERYQKACVPGSPGAERRTECSMDKITQANPMIKRAVKHGIKAHDVLADSGFRRKRFIQAIRQIRKQALHVVCGARKDKRKYGYRGAQVDAYESLGLLFKEIVAKLREKHLAERLWELFAELLQAVFTSMSNSGSMDLQQFQSSPQYVALKNLFEASFLGNQSQSLNMAV